VNATVTDLRPSTRSIQVPALSRDRRREVLVRLGENWSVGRPGHPDEAVLLIAGAASERLSPERRDLLWQAYLRELGRDADYWAGVPRGDLEPWNAGERADMALADLVHGTDFYAITTGEI
jgi:hypothetical protein